MTTSAWVAIGYVALALIMVGKAVNDEVRFRRRKRDVALCKSVLAEMDANKARRDAGEIDALQCLELNLAAADRLPKARKSTIRRIGREWGIFPLAKAPAETPPNAA